MTAVLVAGSIATILGLLVQAWALQVPHLRWRVGKTSVLLMIVGMVVVVVTSNVMFWPSL